MDLVYLDFNCFQRSFDDPSQVRIQMESLACQEVFRKAEQEKLILIWSFMHVDENLLCPFPERKIEVARLSVLCKERVKPLQEIKTIAKSFQEKTSLTSKDALHLACAFNFKAGFFLSCDDKLIKQGNKLDLNMGIMNPVDYIKRLKK